MKKTKKTDASGLPIGMAIGLALGTAIGAATENIGLWMPVGMALGIALGAAFSAKDTHKNKDDEEGDK